MGVFCYINEMTFGPLWSPKVEGWLPGEPKTRLEVWDFQSHPLTSEEGRGGGGELHHQRPMI